MAYNTERRNTQLGQEKVEFPITGKIVSVNVKPGDKVEEGDTLCVLDSMKMENPILAPVGGKVSKIELAPGQVVRTGELVAIIDY